MATQEKPKMDRSAAMAEGTRMLALLRVFEHSVEVMQRAHADEEGAKEREKRLEELDTELQGMEEQRNALQTEIEDLQKKRGEGLAALEKEQEERTRKATEKADREIHAAEAQKSVRLRQIRSDILKEEERLKVATQRAEIAKAALAAAQEQHQAFVRKVTRQ